jgi:hypothetical protein
MCIRGLTGVRFKLSTRFTPLTILSEYAAVAAINNNFATIASLLDEAVFRDGSAPNSLTHDLDANHFTIKNLAPPVDLLDPVRLVDLNNAIATLTGISGVTVSGTMVIGLFGAGASLSIPTDINLIMTSGYTQIGRGAGLYVYDSTVDAAFVTAYPGSSFVTTNGRGFRLIGLDGKTVNPFQFGAVDATGTPKGSDEVVYNCSDALDHMWAYVKHMKSARNILYTMDLSTCLGLGVTRTWYLEGDLSTAFWNSVTYTIYPGRLVAMAAVDAIVSINGKAWECIGEWELYGGTDTILNSGSMKNIYAKYGMIIADAGGSQFGDITVQGVRRFGLKCTEVGGGNNIPLSFGAVKLVQCGAYSTMFGGTYDTGTWTNQPADNDEYTQKHRMRLVVTGGFDTSDLEIGDPIFFNGTDLGFIQAIPSLTSTTATVDIYPWQSTEASGTFKSYHGGGLDLRGGNLANTNFGVVEAFVCGTGVRYSCLYGPTIRTLLCESTLLCVQLGFGGQLESMEGISIEHLHFESIVYAVVDAAASCSAAWFGTPSNLEGTGRGKFDKCFRVNPANVVSGTWSRAYRVSLRGVGFRMNGGAVESPNSLNIEYNGGGGNVTTISNSPEYQYGPIYANDFNFKLYVERSLAEKISNHKSVQWGPIYGSGTNGAPTGDITFTIDTSFGNQGTVTVAGGSTKTITSSDGALMGICVYEPPVTTGDNGDWKVLYWTVKKA